MSALKIRIYGDPVLRETAAPIEKVEERHRRLAQEMAELMYAARGIGLAANQVGVLERIIIVDVDWTDDNAQRRPTVMINPEILEETVEDDVRSEGCLSIPDIEGDVWRPLGVRYRYTTLDRREVEEEARGLKARCIQHEIDHLNGVLFIDHMAADQREKLAGRLARLRQQHE